LVSAENKDRCVVDHKAWNTAIDDGSVAKTKISTLQRVSRTAGRTLRQVHRSNQTIFRRRAAKAALPLLRVTLPQPQFWSGLDLLSPWDLQASILTNASSLAKTSANLLSLLRPLFRNSAGQDAEPIRRSKSHSRGAAHQTKRGSRGCPAPYYDCG
jgi:hypothetical protein